MGPLSPAGDAAPPRVLAVSESPHPATGALSPVTYQPLNELLSGLGQCCVASGEPSCPALPNPSKSCCWSSVVATTLGLGLPAQLSFASLSWAEDSFPPSGSSAPRPAPPWRYCSATLSSSLLPKPTDFSFLFFF